MNVFWKYIPMFFSNQIGWDKLENSVHELDAMLPESQLNALENLV